MFDATGAIQEAPHIVGQGLVDSLQGLLAFDHRADQAFVSSGAFGIVKELAVGLG